MSGLALPSRGNPPVLQPTPIPQSSPARPNGASAAAIPAGKVRDKPAVPAGIMGSETVKLTAETLGINKLDETVAVALAGDVEFRLHQVIEEAQQFMRHAKRTTLLPSDIDFALQTMNIEPLYGHLPLPSAAAAKFVPLRMPPPGSNPNASASSQQGSYIYYLQDEEIDFETLLKAPPPPAAAGGVRWEAHWLAVEGVIPKIPQNVATGVASENGVSTSKVKTQQSEILEKPSVSLELQLYFSRLTSALLPPPNASAIPAEHQENTLSEAETGRLAALGSLRTDSGLQPLVVYLVRWIGEKILENLTETSRLQPLIDGIAAMLGNETLFLEPYLHQLLPSLLTPLLTHPLGSASPSPSDPTPTEVRKVAAQVLDIFVEQFGKSFSTLLPRITKQLLRAVVPPTPAGRTIGAILGAGAVGKEGVRKVLWGDQGRGLKEFAETVVGQADWTEEEKKEVVSTASSVLVNLLASSPAPSGPSSSEQQQTLRDYFGDVFASEIAKDSQLGEGLVELLETERTNGTGRLAPISTRLLSPLPALAPAPAAGPAFAPVTPAAQPAPADIPRPAEETSGMDVDIQGNGDKPPVEGQPETANGVERGAANGDADADGDDDDDMVEV